MRTITSRCRSVIDGCLYPSRSSWDEATTDGSIAPLTGGCNPGRILGRVLAIDHIQLAAPPGCEQAARRFFGELLGLEEIPKPEPINARGGVWFRVGPHELHIGVEPDCARAQGAPGLPGRRLQRAEGAAAQRWRRGRRRRRDPRSPPLLRRRSVGQPDRADLSRIARGLSSPASWAGVWPSSAARAGSAPACEQRLDASRGRRSAAAEWDGAKPPSWAAFGVGARLEQQLHDPRRGSRRRRCAAASRGCSRCGRRPPPPPRARAGSAPRPPGRRTRRSGAP